MLWRCCLGDRNGIRPVKNRVVRYWLGCLSGAWCKWFAYGPADATSTPSYLAPITSIMFTFLVPAYPGIKAVKRICSSSSSSSYWCLTIRVVRIVSPTVSWRGPFQLVHTINGCVGPGNARQQFLGAQERRSPAFPLTLTTVYLSVMYSLYSMPTVIPSSLYASCGILSGSVLSRANIVWLNLPFITCDAFCHGLCQTTWLCFWPLTSDDQATVQRRIWTPNFDVGRLFALEL